MQRIKASGVVSVIPPVQENSYDPGYFSNGNPATGELATMMTAEWCNGVQEELLAVIQEAKLTPSGSDLGQLLKALKHLFSSSDAEMFRKSMIGSIAYFSRGTLPSGWMACDGSLALFADYPEFKAAYDGGAFNGMILEATASSGDKDAWRGKFVKNSETPTGLYLPRLSGLFLRNVVSNDIGGYQQDAVQTGIKIINTRRVHNGTAVIFVHGNVIDEGFTPGTQGSCQSGTENMGLERYIVNQRMADETRPSNVSLLLGIYLGRSTEV